MLKAKEKPSPEGQMLENVTFDELKLGRKASLTRTLTQKDIELFAAMSGDVNPEHIDLSMPKAICFTASSAMACGLVL